MASEKLRQREVHKYYQSWLDSSIGFDTAPSSQLSRFLPDGSRLRISKDKALIAFAQLSCLKLNAKRSIVTLIATEQQYILAEATKTLSLISGDGDSDFQDEVWFGNASLPRSQGVSGDALAPPDYTAIGADGTSYTAPALVVNDLTTHEKYRTRSYAGKGVTFYCGVPILTESGIPIGVYTVTDDKPRNGLKPKELRFLHDMATIVMRHLEVVSNEAARFRGETLVLGLGKFISGAPSLHDGTLASADPATYTSSPNHNSFRDRTPRAIEGMTITAANPSKLRTVNAEAKLPTTPQALESEPSNTLTESSDHKGLLGSSSDFALRDEQPDPELVTADEEKLPGKARSQPAFDQRSKTVPDNIFSRAAQILRECVAADGVLFFDAVSTNFTTMMNVSGDRAPDERPDHNGISPAIPTQTSADSFLIPERKNSTFALYTGASEESDVGALHKGEKRMCKLLGYAFDPSAKNSSTIDVLDNVQMTERSLSRLVKMYPQGKIFSFHADGGLSASEAEHFTEDASYPPSLAKPSRIITSDKSKRVPRMIADELERLVPHAQSIVWLPLWDFSKQRWSAGLFLWSKRPDRLVAAQDDLVYLKAFANSIMVEVARLDAAMADTAKSTFIANISHELRTPLHGILGNLDILQDTKLSDFQQSLLTAIEVCGRTLTDTIDHVLDYSKINQLSKHNKKRNKSTSVLLPLLDPGLAANSGMSLIDQDFDIASIIEEAVEAAYASHTFQYNGRTRLRASSLTGTKPPEDVPAPTEASQRVHVILDLEHRDSWWVRSQPSAIRRVVTNLFGNALKYTDAGTIQITLSTPHSAKKFSPSSNIAILLSVKDTGRGMSSDFIRNHAFIPFSQESQFSTGTGLGLSIVQQIVKSLGGKIELQSDQGSGTEMKVFLNLPAAEREEPKPQKKVPMWWDSAPRKSSELSMRITTAEGNDDNQAFLKHQAVISSVKKIALKWFGLYCRTDGSVEDNHSDLVLYVTPPSPEELRRAVLSLNRFSRVHFIIVASNTIEKANLAELYSETATETGHHVNVLSYPLGPQKLGKAIMKCLEPVEIKEESKQLKVDENQDTPSPKSMSPTLAALPRVSIEVGATIESSADTCSSVAQPRQHSLQASHTSIASPEQLQDISLVSAGQDDNEAERSPPESTSKSLEKNPLNALRADARSRPPAMMPRSMSAPDPLLLNKGIPKAHRSFRVLLVDDNDINLSILKTCMKRAQIPYDFAKDGLQASSLFQQGFNSKDAFTHVLMDINMPVMDGIQATREIRAFERRQSSLQRISSRVETADKAEEATRPTTPDLEVDLDQMESQSTESRAVIIALSGVASESTQLEMLEAGGDMFLPKPVKLRELVKIIGA